MAAVIQVDVAQAREDVKALNADIKNIASSIGDIKSAFGGGDFAGAMLADLQKIGSEFKAMQDIVKSLNVDLQTTEKTIGNYSAATGGMVGTARSASTAILAKAQALNQERAALDATSDSVRKLSAAEAEANIVWASQEKVIRSTITAAQLKRNVMSELADMELAGQITTQQSLRYQEQMIATYQKTGTAAEVMLQKLREENTLYHASAQAVLERTAGFRTMTEAQMKALQTQDQLATDLSRTNALFQSSGSIIQEYNVDLLALGRIKAAGLATDQQYASAMAALDRRFDDQLSKVRASTKAMQDRAYAESEAAKREQLVQDAINRTTGSLQRGLDPIAQYVARLRDLNTAAAGASTQSGSRIGITSQQYTAGLAGARQELEKNIASGMRMQSVQSQLNNQFNIGTQAAAGFRAGLQGAGLGFGIFTSNTIVAATAVYGVTKAIKESIASGAEFQDVFNRAGAMLGAFDLATGQPSQALGALRAQVMGLAETTRFSSTEVAQALTAMGQAGYSTAEAMKALPTVLNLATVGEISTEEAANKLINTITAFGKGAGDAAEMADKLTKASLVSTTTITDLMVGLGQTSAAAHNANISFADTLGALAAMRQAGIQASKTGTDLRNIIQSLANPTSKASALFSQLGIDIKSFYDKDGLNLSLMLTTLHDKMGTLGKDAQTLLAQEWFGKRSATGFQTLITSLSDSQHGVKAMTDQIKDANGTTQQLADIINNNAKVAFMELGHTIENVAIDSFSAYGSKLTDDLKGFADYVRSNGPAISKTISDITSFVIGLTEAIVKNGSTIATTFVVYEGFRTLQAAAQSIFGLWGKANAAYVAATQLSTAATIENEMAVNARTVTGMKFTAEIEGEVLALNAQAAAATRGAAATVEVGAASAAAVGGVGLLRAAGSGLLAMVGGWPTLIAGAVVATGYFAYQLNKSSHEIEVPLGQLKVQLNDVVASAKNLSALDMSGLTAFGGNVKGDIEETTKALEDLQHNIQLLYEKASSGKIGDSGPMFVFTPEQKALLDSMQAGVVLLKDNLTQLKNVSEQIDINKMFKAPAIVPLLGDLDKLDDKLLRSGNSAAAMSSAMLLFFNNLRMQGKITEQMYAEIVNQQKVLTDNLLRAAQNRAINEGFGPGPAAAPTHDLSSDLNAAKSRASELASEMKSIVQQFEKSTNAAAEFSHQFDEISTLADNIGSGKVSAELKKIGVSADEARAALDWKAGNVTFEMLKKALADLNPLFANLKDPTKDLVDESNDLGAAYALVDSMIAKVIQKNPELAAVMHSTAEQIKAELPGILDGSTAALAQFDVAVRDQQKNLDAAFKVENLDTFLAAVTASGRELDATSIGAQALASANVALGGSMKAVQKSIAAVTDPQQEANSLQAIWIKLLNDPVMQAAPAELAAYGRALQLVADATPLGQLEKSNEDLKNQIALLSSGTQNLSEYATLWKLTKGGVLEATDAMVKAAHEQALLNEQMEKMQQVQGTFKGFASDLGGAFAKFFTDTNHSFKSFLGDIKSSFKNLILDLIKQAATNQILFYFGFNQQGMGGGGGSLGGIVGAFMSLFGGGGGGGSGSGIDLSALAGTGAANNASIPGSQFYNLGLTGSFTGNGQAGGGGFIGGVQQAGSIYQLGQSGYNLYNGGLSGMYGNARNAYGSFISGSGQTLPGAGYLGSSVYGPGMDTSFAASGLTTGLSVAGGLYAGYNRYQNSNGGVAGAAGGLAYGVGTTALGFGATGVATGAGFAAGVGGMAGAAGTAAAIPVIGWIALALMVVDMVTGGGLFGTKANKFIGGATDLKVGDQGADLSGHYTFKGKKPLFGGSYYDTKPMEVTDEMQAQADAVWNQIHNFGKTAASTLGVALATGIEGNFESQFDKNGNVTKSISTVLGKTYEEPLEDFIKRMKAETLVATVSESIVAMGGNAEEASKIADSFRADATTFLDAAQLMLQAQVDIKNGVGLLREAGGAGVLTDTIAVVQQLTQDGETLQQTYARLTAETQLVVSIMNVAGSTMAQSGKDFVIFSDDFVNAMGGLDKATAQWAMFSSTILQGSNQISQATSSGALSGQLDALGLSADTTIQQFATAFKDVAGTLSATDLAAWVNAGAAMGAIQQSLQILQGMADGVDISGILSQQAQLVQSINAQIDAAARLGASEKDLAEMRRLGQLAIDNQLKDFMGGIESQTQKLMGGDFTYQFEQIRVQMLRNIDTARALGASEHDLAEIQQLATLQTAQLIAQLKNSIADLVGQLHGTNNQSHSNSLQQQANEGRNALLQAQKDLYTAAQSAIKDIKQFLDSLQTGDLSPHDYQTQLNSAQTQFQDLVARARTGDTDAMAQLTQYAQTYLQEAQSAYGNSVTYGSIFDNVTSVLQELSNQFALIQAPPEPTTGAGGSGTPQVQLTESDRFSLSMQIANQIGALGLALNVSVFDLMEKFGTSLGELSANLGINIHNMSDDTVNGLLILSGALHVSMVDLLNALGATPAEIGAYFQVTVDQINAGNFANIRTMADALGMSVFDAIQYIGGDLATAIAAAGINIASLDPATMEALATISTTLGVSIVDLLTQLGVSVETFAQPLADTIRDDLSKIPDLATDTIAGITPLLAELGAAVNEGDLNKALADINAYLSTLPDDQRKKLEDLFTTLGINIDGTNATLGTQTDVQTTIASNTTNMTLGIGTLNDTVTNLVATPLSSIQAFSGDSLTALRSILTVLGGSLSDLTTPNDVGMSDIIRGGGAHSGGSRENPRIPPGGRGDAGGGTQNAHAEQMGSAGERLFNTINTNEGQRRSVEQQERIAEQLTEVGKRVDVLTSVVATKIDKTNEIQAHTAKATKTMVKQNKSSKINRSVKK